METIFRVLVIVFLAFTYTNSSFIQQLFAKLPFRGKLQFNDKIYLINTESYQLSNQQKENDINTEITTGTDELLEETTVDSSLNEQSNNMDINETKTTFVDKKANISDYRNQITKNITFDSLNNTTESYVPVIGFIDTMIIEPQEGFDKSINGTTKKTYNASEYIQLAHPYRKSEEIITTNSSPFIETYTKNMIERSQINIFNITQQNEFEKNENKSDKKTTDITTTNYPLNEQYPSIMVLDGLEDIFNISGESTQFDNITRNENISGNISNYENLNDNYFKNVVLEESDEGFDNVNITEKYSKEELKQREKLKENQSRGNITLGPFYLY